MGIISQILIFAAIGYPLLYTGPNCFVYSVDHNDTFDHTYYTEPGHLIKHLKYQVEISIVN